jgi:hypothetical protein
LERLVVSEDQICVQWGQTVLEKEGFADWNIDFSPAKSCEGITIWKTKTIFIHWPEGKPNYSLMAHEIAHVCRKESGHDSQYAHEFMWLVEKYFKPII